MLDKQHNDPLYIRTLLVKELFGNLNPDEENALKEILETDEAARQMREEIQSTPLPDAQNYLEKFDPEAGLEDVFVREERLSGTRRRWMIGTAAAVVITVAISFFLLNNHRLPPVPLAQTEATQQKGSATLTLANGKVLALQDSGLQQLTAGTTNLNNTNRRLQFSGNEESTSWNTLTVPARLDYQIELSDGTIVWLNSTTKFRFPFAFGKESRDVYIDQGEAYFDVKKLADRPFIVHTSQGDVKVLGTEFNVNTYTAGQMITSLVSGKVQVDKEILQPGKEVVARQGQPAVIRNFDATTTLSWRQGIHYFNDAPVTAIAEMLERWFDTKLVIDNPKAAATQLRGKLYRHKPLQEFIDQINLTGDITFYWKEGVLHCR